MATSDKDKGKQAKQSDTSKRGFASMDPEQQREIAAEGGRAAHEKGTAHEFTSEEARRAGSMSHKNDPGPQQPERFVGQQFWQRAATRQCQQQQRRRRGQRRQRAAAVVPAAARAAARAAVPATVPNP
jgi:general stress protein YciG